MAAVTQELSAVNAFLWMMCMAPVWLGDYVLTGDYPTGGPRTTLWESLP
jgi:hypothetical protein